MSQDSATQRHNALIIFVKNPVPGQVKTRLARYIGNQAAADVYRKLLERTESVVSQLTAVDKFVYYADALNMNDLWDNRSYTKRLQWGSDLGERMSHAFQNCLAQNYQRVVIIGSDCWDLRIDLLEQAFSALLTHDLVVGPAVDGGYYLLGMKRLYRQLFADVAWSTSSVRQATLEIAANDQLSYHLLEALDDIDELEDYERIKDHLKD